MKEKFESWNPEPESLKQLQTITGIVAEFEKDDIVITLRQLHYQLVSRGLGPNTLRAYKNLGNLLSRARLAGFIDWDAVTDRGRKAVVWSSFDSIQACVADAARNFTLPRWDDQDEYVELWCEKDALTSVIEPICAELFTPLMINKGYSSSSAMYDARNRIRRRANGRPATILYLGDFDPSGEDMVRDVRDRLHHFRLGSLTVNKIALNPDQIKKWKCPPNPLKTDGAGNLSDSRGAAFAAEHGHRSYEVDAIPPRELQKLIKESIQDHMDLGKYQDVLEREDELTKRLTKAVAGIK